MTNTISAIQFTASFPNTGNGESNLGSFDTGAKPAIDAKPSLPAPQEIDDTAKKLELAQRSKVELLSAKLSGAGSKLIIEKNPNAAGFIYKSLNPVTGEVTKIWPKREIVEALQSMPESDTRGMVIDESA